MFIQCTRVKLVENNCELCTLSCFFGFCFENMSTTDVVIYEEVNKVVVYENTEKQSIRDSTFYKIYLSFETLLTAQTQPCFCCGKKFQRN